MVRLSAARPAAACLLAVAWAGTATAQPAVTVAPAAPDAGFDLVVVGGIPGQPPEEFGKAVARALPERLTDSGTNFTANPAYKKGESYRIVLVFHGEDAVDAGTLCPAHEKVEAAPPAPPEDLMQATHVTAAFCKAGETLSSASDRMIGSVEPGQAGFRFLVSDVVKQLFPNGFDQMPGTTTTPVDSTSQP